MHPEGGDTAQLPSADEAPVHKRKKRPNKNKKPKKRKYKEPELDPDKAEKLKEQLEESNPS